MDLSNNICSLCCSLQPRAALARLWPHSEFLSLLLGSEERSILVCPSCRGEVGRFRDWWLSCKQNLERLKQVEIEQEKLLEQQHPDTTSEVDGRIEISLTENADEDLSVMRPKNVITITKIDAIHSESNKTNNDRENSLGISEMFVPKHNPFSNNVYETQFPTDLSFQNKALNLVRRENVDIDTVDKDEECEYIEDDNEEREDAVSPPPPPSPSSHHVPIIIPSLTQQYNSSSLENQPCRPPEAFKGSNLLSQEERRKHRNREASRRYREKARGAPELLKKMREQQNRRQKKYYARLKEKKQMKRLSQIPSPWMSATLETPELLKKMREQQNRRQK